MTFKSKFFVASLKFSMKMMPKLETGIIRSAFTIHFGTTQKL